MNIINVINEEIKSSLKENPNIVKDDSEIIARFYDPDTVVFFRDDSNNKLYYLEYDDSFKTHSKIIDYFNLNPFKKFKERGRLWKHSKLISFWDYPSKNDFFKLITDLENELGIKILNNNWRIAVYQTNDKSKSTLIPIEDYQGKYYDQLSVDHIVSPLEKKKKTPSYNKYKKYKITPAEYRFYKEKNVAEEIIKKEIYKLINENKQLADKIYFNTGKISEEHKRIILYITNGDNYTKLIADFSYYLSENNSTYNTQQHYKDLEFLYNEVKNYNKNVFPIIGYDVYKPENVENIISSLRVRSKIIKEIKKLPSFAIRNLKEDIRKERNYLQLNDYLQNLEYFMAQYSLLYNRPEEIQKKILQKMFKGGTTTLEDLMDFVDEKENFIGGVEMTKEDVKEMSQYEDFEIIYEQGNSMIVRVDSPDGIKAIGCNSLWCFTYGTGFEYAHRQWSEYSHNDMVYVLIDFNGGINLADFMFVLISPLIDENGELLTYDYDDADARPDEIPLYDMLNENHYCPYHILESLFGKNYKEIIYKYLNFEY